MNRSVFVGASLLLSCVLGHVSAQDSVLAEVYGQGVHAYYSRNYQVAHELLSSAIEQGARDPRCYYFRGLAYAALGRPDEANADFKKGAELEVTTTDRIYPVSDSLQRVQGRVRLDIERYRQSARLASHLQASKIQQARYEEMKRNEQQVVRDPNRAAAPGVSPGPALPPEMNTAPPAAGGASAAENDPFAGNAEVMPEKAPEKPAEPAVEPAVPAADDPFGTPAPGPAPTPTPDDSKVDPFADDKPAGGQPAPPPAEKPADDDPFK